jgi:hypothetical protein
MPQSDVAASLTNDFVVQMSECSNQLISGYTAWKLHAASKGINSSLT